ncbi:MAG: M43 family zinc metalloprotease [Flavobacteriales bacterium]
MKKILLSTAVMAGLTGALSAQHVHTAACGSPNYRESMQNPQFAAEQAAFQTYLDQLPAAPPGLKANELRIVPVVVHIVHDGSSVSNIPNADVHTMISKINQAYNRATPNIGNLPLSFDSLATDAQLEFRLATLDPQGNCTDGIRRIYAPYATANTYEDKNFKALSYWDRSRYLNIWVVRNIREPGSSGPGSILGYAYLPGGAQALKDGPVVDASSTVLQAVPAHEVGHFLNLVHIWGDEICGDDMVEDTPISDTANFAWNDPCGSSVKEAVCYDDWQTSQLDSIRRFVIGENYQNLMDYVNNYNCPSMFTRGQVQRMRSALDFYPFRKNLWQQANLTGTGVADGAAACTAYKPYADFWATDNTICAGQTVNFRDGSFNGNISPATHQWSWTFEGGSPAASTSQNPVVTYNTPGVYSVSMSISSANGSSSISRTAYIHVMPTDVESKSWGYRDGIEIGDPFEQGKWTVVNEPNPAKGWHRSNAASYTDNFSLVCRNIGSVRDAKYVLISPAYNMSAVSGGNIKLRFKSAYVLRTGNSIGFDEEDQRAYAIEPDRLLVSRSTDCGLNWTPLKLFTATELSHNTINPNEFIPSGKADWAQQSIDLTGSKANGSDVRFRFEFTAGGQFNNNLWLDDFEIFSANTVTVEEMDAADLLLNVFPNPVSGISTLQFHLPQSVQEVNVSAYDMVGKKVAALYQGPLTAGTQNITLDRAVFGAAGVYVIQVTLGSRSFTEKIVIR